jgi:hypothetical protein
MQYGFKAVIVSETGKFNAVKFTVSLLMQVLVVSVAVKIQELLALTLMLMVSLDIGERFQL